METDRWQHGGRATDGEPAFAGCEFGGVAVAAREERDCDGAAGGCSFHPAHGNTRRRGTRVCMPDAGRCGQDGAGSVHRYLHFLFAKITKVVGIDQAMAMDCREACACLSWRPGSISRSMEETPVRLTV